MANSNLTNAKRAKNDEFYTQYGNMNAITYKEIKGKKAYDKYDKFDSRI